MLVKKQIKRYYRLIRNQVKFLWSKPIIVFVNHQVSDNFISGVDCESDWNSLDLYKKNIEWIVKNYEVITLERAINLIDSGKRIKKKYAVLTFDDGYASVSNALLILEQNNLPATLFINTAYLNDRNYSPVNIYNYVMAQEEPLRCFPESLVNACKRLVGLTDALEYKQVLSVLKESVNLVQPRQNIYFTIEELKVLNQSLFTISLHGHEHLVSHLLSDEEFLVNVNKNISILGVLPNFKPYFAFPFGLTDTRKTALIADLGLKPVLCNAQCYKRGDKSVNRVPVDGLKLWEKFR